jgi:hypothetical protein
MIDVHGEAVTSRELPAAAGLDAGREKPPAPGPAATTES